jgi:hypothetical protein
MGMVFRRSVRYKYYISMEGLKHANHSTKKKPGQIPSQPPPLGVFWRY